MSEFRIFTDWDFTNNEEVSDTATPHSQGPLAKERGGEIVQGVFLKLTVKGDYPAVKVDLLARVGYQFIHQVNHPQYQQLAASQIWHRWTDKPVNLRSSGLIREEGEKYPESESTLETQQESSHL